MTSPEALPAGSTDPFMGYMEPLVSLPGAGGAVFHRAGRSDSPDIRADRDLDLVLGGMSVFPALTVLGVTLARPPLLLATDLDVAVPCLWATGAISSLIAKRS